MRMPKMSGLELHRHLVASNRAIPTILMTAYPDERTQAQAINDDVVTYLIKPCAADELLACVRRAVRSHADNSSSSGARAARCAGLTT
jgi:DNA-binding NtrC family response regulator